MILPHNAAGLILFLIFNDMHALKRLSRQA
jgi:hypothetical protein